MRLFVSMLMAGSLLSELMMDGLIEHEKFFGFKS
jgi:hypothetical protein